MEFSTDRSSLVALFDDSFPSDTWPLPSNCVIARSREVNQHDISDVVDIVTRERGRQGLVNRLKLTHPLIRNHHQQFDERLWDALCEATAFAWAADVGCIGRPEFVEDEGLPDLWTSSDMWIEVKRIHESMDQEQASRFMADHTVTYQMFTQRTVPHPSLLKKFKDQLDDARRKFDRAGALAGRVVYFCVTLDPGTPETTTWLALKKWATSASVACHVRIVVATGFGDWQHPVIDVEG